ncbi:trimeric intracellular cation channel family protein [Bifidobacterium saguinibicoloris]|uniref:trimeric intracellular cation channel family protein n=1 Tax=Bifidobacterium saguinibicoloris TaxID=2834433 RepID=UPI001C595C8C|nr:TRIC cation channel family protein [Bifidobacterium saguinibicoloris]MBW3081701.1 TRIC cation channel family protein [Bifidobacterium saguinibicoloris]
MLVEYVAVFCCGLVGGLAAVHKEYDLFAILVTAWLTALGGGVLRDVLLEVPPVGITDKWSVVTALVSGVAIAVLHLEVDKLKWSMLTLDALALGLFAVIGTSKAMYLGSSGMTSVFLGMATALGGGLVRDMLLNDVPMIIRDKHWYAVPSALGCVLTVFVCKGRIAGLLDAEQEIALDIVIIALIVGLRLASVIFNIKFPGAVERRTVYLPGEGRYLRRPDITPKPRGGETPKRSRWDDDGDERE